MKAFDKQNSKAREKAGDQPYYKKVVEFEKACPYCDGLIRFYRRDEHSCDCGTWQFNWSDSEYVYSKGKQNEMP